MWLVPWSFECASLSLCHIAECQVTFKVTQNFFYYRSPHMDQFPLEKRALRLQPALLEGRCIPQALVVTVTLSPEHSWDIDVPCVLLLAADTSPNAGSWPSSEGKGLQRPPALSTSWLVSAGAVWQWERLSCQAAPCRALASCHSEFQGSHSSFSSSFSPKFMGTWTINWHHKAVLAWTLFWANHYDIGGHLPNHRRGLKALIPSPSSISLTTERVWEWLRHHYRNGITENGKYD